MSTTRRIQSALISVYHKEGLAPIVKELQRIGATIYSTGGTQAAIEALGAEVVPVEQVIEIKRRAVSQELDGRSIHTEKPVREDVKRMT